MTMTLYQKFRRHFSRPSKGGGKKTNSYTFLSSKISLGQVQERYERCKKYKKYPHRRVHSDHIYSTTLYSIQLAQRRSIVYDVGPTLNQHQFEVLCLMGCSYRTNCKKMNKPSDPMGLTEFSCTIWRTR